MKSKQWFSSNTFHHSQFSDIKILVDKKKALGYKISVGIPTYNEEETIYNEIRVIQEHLMERFNLVDEIVVVDGGSTDNTKNEAIRAGAEFHVSSEILKEKGTLNGKGENLWKSLYVLKGDIIVWFDADIKNIAPKFVYGLLGPLLNSSEIGYVKAFYNRPLREGIELRPSGGGRVTEILIRPLLGLFYPELAYIMQPLSGEYAGKREILETLPFSIGYGVEIGHLLDLYNLYGLKIIAQVDLDMRIHRNQPIEALGKMSFGILQAFFTHAVSHGKIKLQETLNLDLMQFKSSNNTYELQKTLYQEIERPPMNTIENYTAKRRNLIR